MRLLISTFGVPAESIPLEVAGQRLETTSTPVLIDLDRGLVLRPADGDLREVKMASISFPIHLRERAEFAGLMEFCRSRGIEVSA
jgi:hypothetical protein